MRYAIQSYSSADTLTANVFIADPSRAILSFKAPNGPELSLHIPPHVAEATAAAFNEAMAAVAEAEDAA